MKKRKLIIDTDPGIDDAFGILAAMHNPEIEILGLCAVSGNKSLDVVMKNALRLTDFMNQDIPVICGAAGSLAMLQQGKAAKNDAEIFHGKDGMGDSGMAYSKKNLHSSTAVDFILEKIREYPHEVEIVALGPLTNLALAIQKDKDTMKQLKSLTIMGGSFERPGNVSDYSEFNIWFDPEAADIVMRKLADFVPVTFVGLDATHSCQFTLADLAFLRLEGGKVGQLLAKIIHGYADAYYYNSRILGAVIHDLNTILYCFDSAIATQCKSARVEIALDEEHHGQTCLVQGIPNANVVMKLDTYKVKMNFFALIQPDLEKQYNEIMQGIEL